MRKCCVPGCYSNHREPYVTIFTFPRDTETRQLWLTKIGLPSLKVTESIGVCKKHFDEDYIIGKDDVDKNGADNSIIRKKIKLRPGAIPTIIKKEENNQWNKSIVETEDSQSQDISSMSNSSSSISPKPSKNISKQQIEEITTLVPENSLKLKSPTTTNRPIIAVIKAQDKINDGGFVEKNELCIEKLEDHHDNNSSLEILSSPYKKFPTLNVCLKQEDRILIPKENGKIMKRSLSLGSNSSNGSNETNIKSNTPIKRKKIEKPPPSVRGRKNDCYCWVCHRENIVLCCIMCPRAYHHKCAGELGEPNDWVCPECKKSLAAERVDTRSSTLSDISIDKLSALLKTSLSKLKARAPQAFHQPVPLEYYSSYPEYVIHPMDLSLIEKNVKQKLYGSPEAFLADVKWILHNSCVFNGTQHPLSTNAKSLVKACEYDMQEIEVCPDCFMHNAIHNKFWFSEVCRKPHPLVWAKLKGFPYWPAKVVRIIDGNVDARFFGAHDRAWVPVSQCYHLSKEMPTTSKPKKKGNYEIALNELSIHVHSLRQRFNTFVYAPYRTSFDPDNKYYLYHGIDIEKAAKEDINYDTTIMNEEQINSASKSISLSNAEPYNEKKIEINTKEKEIHDVIQLKSPSDNISNLSSLEDTTKPDSFKLENQTFIDQTSSSHDNKIENIIQLNTDNKLTHSQENTDADQLRNLELVLERIKAISNATDTENEKSKPEENKTSIENCDNNSRDKNDNTLETIKQNTLPSLPSDCDSFQQNDDKKNDKLIKKDLFTLKLTETIESCKAKLGISEIVEDQESSVSESIEDEEDDDDDEEEEKEDASSIDSESNSSSEAEDGSNSESSDSDIEENLHENSNDKGKMEQTSNCNFNEVTPSLKLDINDIKILPAQNNLSSEINNNLIDSDGVVSNEPEKEILQMDSNENVEKHKGNELSTINQNVLEVNKNDDNLISLSSNSSNSSFDTNVFNDIAKENETKDDTIKVNQQSPEVLQNNLINDNDNLSSVFENGVDKESQSKSNRNIDEDDDEIYIYDSPPRKAPTPPLIYLDDSPESPDSHEKNDQHIKSKKENIEKTISKNNQILEISKQAKDNPSKLDTLTQNKTNLSGSQKSCFGEKRLGKRHHSDITDDQVTCRRNLFSQLLKQQDKPTKRFKSFNKYSTINDSSDDEKDDEVKEIAHYAKRTLTGAKRTFSSLMDRNPPKDMILDSKENENQNSLLNNNQINSDESKHNLDVPNEIHLETKNEATVISNGDLDTPKITNSAGQDENESKQSFNNEEVLQEKNEEISRLEEKISLLKRLNQFQAFKYLQELQELRHNMNLMIIEMRNCMEKDKKQAIDVAIKKLDIEKNKMIDEVKKKQWCAWCLTESRYSCCWNTSYCSLLCQKKHFSEHFKSCSQISGQTTDAPDADSKATTSKSSSLSNEASENKNAEKKYFVVNMKSTTDTSKSSIQTSSNAPHQSSQMKIISPKNLTISNIITTANSTSSATQNSPVQLVKAPVKTSSENTQVTNLVTTKNNIVASEQHLDTSDIITNVRNRCYKLDTAISLLKIKNNEVAATLPKEETPKVDETDLEEIYFPMPNVNFEDYDISETSKKEENDETEQNRLSEEENEAEDKNDEGEDKDLILSDGDELDNEMVSIGHGVEVKAKFLNKCLIYGKTPKRLTRCFVDVLFPDTKLLANCSAFGQKSNVTKLTRAALPTRKVQAIIDYVQKRFPNVSRSEIVLAINMKCKEARASMERAEGSCKQKKHLLKRLLEQDQKKSEIKHILEQEKAKIELKASAEQEKKKIETKILPGTHKPPLIKFATPINIASNIKKTPNVVCVKGPSTSITTTTSNIAITQPKIITVPKILTSKPQYLLKPKSHAASDGSAPVIVSSSPQTITVKPTTIKTLLSSPSAIRQLNTVTSEGKIMMPVQMISSSTHTANINHSITTNSTSAAQNRPVIIVGTSLSTTQQSSNAQIRHPISGAVLKKLL